MMQLVLARGQLAYSNIDQKAPRLTTLRSGQPPHSLGIICPKTGQEGHVWPNPLGSDSKGLASAFGFG